MQLNGSTFAVAKPPMNAFSFAEGRMENDEEQLLQRIWSLLRLVQDPEVRLDIVNLGLIYNISLERVPAPPPIAPIAKPPTWWERLKKFWQPPASDTVIDKTPANNSPPMSMQHTSSSSLRTQDSHPTDATPAQDPISSVSDGTTPSTSDTAFRVKIEMTLTSPTCVMGPQIFANIHSTLGFLPGVASVDIALVWDPPWTKDRLSEAGKMELGLL